jgi:hypothetical protein
MTTAAATYAEYYGGVFPVESKVLDGEVYGPEGDDLLGNYVEVIASDVRDQVAFGPNASIDGTVVLPNILTVLDGIQYGAGGTEFTGSMVADDWTAGERAQIRYRLGIDGTQTAPTSAVGHVELDSAVTDQLDEIQATQEATIVLLQGVEVVHVPIPNVQGNLILTQGDTYDGIANPKLQWIVTTDYTDGWVVVLTIRDVDDNIVYSTAGVVESETVIAIEIETPTGLPMTGCPGQWQGKFDVELSKEGRKKTIVLGVCYVNEDQTR